MGIVYTDLRLANHSRAELEKINVTALVDTGAWHPCIPEHVAVQLQLRQFPSLAEYVLINPVKRKAEIFRRDTTGHWVLHEYGGDDPVLFASLELTIVSPVLYENLE